MELQVYKRVSIDDGLGNEVLEGTECLQSRSMEKKKKKKRNKKKRKEEEEIDNSVPQKEGKFGTKPYRIP